MLQKNERCVWRFGAKLFTFFILLYFGNAEKWNPTVFVCHCKFYRSKNTYHENLVEIRQTKRTNKKGRNNVNREEVAAVGFDNIMFFYKIVFLLFDMHFDKM